MWGLVDKGVGLNDIQSILFREYLDVLVEGMRGLNCVTHGLAVTGNANLVPSVAKGGVMANGVLFPVAAATVTIGAAHATLPRLDLIVVTSAGALAVRAGTAATNPKPPVRTTNDVVIAVAYVPATATSLATANFTDLRLVRNRLTLKKTTTAVTFSNTSAIQTFFTVTLPSGLLLAGEALRVSCGGSYVAAAAMTLTLTIAYGGTTMFADVTAATAIDTDRGAWALDFTINASANAAQQIVGTITVQTPGAKTAATTGQGDMAVVTHVGTPLRGTAAVDSDAADRTLDVRWTQSVANAGNDITMDYGYAELI